MSVLTYYQDQLHNICQSWHIQVRRADEEEDEAVDSKIPRLLNLALAGALTGNELGGLIAVHPALGNLPAEEHIRAEQEIYRRYGRIMPFFMTATVASAIPVLSANGDRGSAEFRLTLAGMACFATMLAVTLTGNVPINKRILELPAREEFYEEFLDLRRRWDRLHVVRNLLNVAGFTLSSLAALSRSGPGSPVR
jgi:hypothetical protein